MSIYLYLSNSNFLCFSSSVHLRITAFSQIARKHLFIDIQADSNQQCLRVLYMWRAPSAPSVPCLWSPWRQGILALQHFGLFPQSLIDSLLRSCQANQKIAFSSRGISRFRVFKMFAVIAPWQSFLPWSGLYIMDCHEIIIACLWTNQLVEAEGNYFLCVLLSAHRTFASDNGPGGK